MRIALITKPDCSRCMELKAYLAEKNVQYEEWDLQSPEVQTNLLADPDFVTNFCEEDGCTVVTPLVYDFTTQEFHSKELFGPTGLRKRFINHLLMIV